jgi:putative isomerase
MPFADQGAWFGFALPSADRTDLNAGFAGPFLVSSGRWLGPQIAGLEIPARSPGQAVGLPGALVQTWQTEGLQVTQTLWYHDARTAVVETRAHNRGELARTLPLVWAGRVFEGAAELAGDGQLVEAIAPGGEHLRIWVDRCVESVEIDGESYRLSLSKGVTIEPATTATVVLVITLTMPGDGPIDPAPILANPAISFQDNAVRWDAYLDATRPAYCDSRRVVAVKAVETLVCNWRAATGRFHHGGLFPSSNVGYFNGFWAWDSWKHAVGLARFAPGVAADQLRLMAAQQDEHGMIADVVYLDPDEDNWRDSKPPLLGWALQEVHAVTGDLGLVRELFPTLVRYHQWWYDNRDHDRDGLCEYGSTDGTIVAARWESGMDNAVRFDSTQMLQNGPQAWSMDQEAVDLNSYLYREKVALADLAGALGERAAAQRWAEEAANLRLKIQETMFNESSGWFHDVAIDGSGFVDVQGPEGWIPLWAGVATHKQAAMVRDTMLDPSRFRTHVPFPTVDASHPELSDGYWRGLVWLDQVYFAIEGLRAYGYDQDADALVDQLFANLEGVDLPGVPLRETYHPLTGAGCNANHFSWTAAHLLLLAVAES